jgi:hypothetical protein
METQDFINAAVKSHINKKILYFLVTNCLDYEEALIRLELNREEILDTTITDFLFSEEELLAKSWILNNCAIDHPYFSLKFRPVRVDKNRTQIGSTFGTVDFETLKEECFTPFNVKRMVQLARHISSS